MERASVKAVSLQSSCVRGGSRASMGGPQPASSGGRHKGKCPHLPSEATPQGFEGRAFTFTGGKMIFLKFTYANIE